MVDFGSMVQCLNKLDVGVSEKVLLMSPDENTLLVVSYADLKACCERSFLELLNSGACLCTCTCTCHTNELHQPLPHSV